MKNITITKELFLDVLRCSKAAYLRANNPEAATDAWYLPLPEQQQEVYDMVCSQIRPNAYNIIKKAEGWNALAEKTFQKLNSKTPALQNAVFLSSDNERAVIPIIEAGAKLTAWLVKDSSGRLYERDLWGAAYDYYVMKKCGLKVDNLLIALLNPNYLKDGDTNLFECQAVTDKCAKAQQMVENYINVLKKVLRNNTLPHVALGYDCQQPNECVFKKFCWGHIGKGNVFELTDMSFPQRFRLYSKGMVYLKDLHASVKLSDAEKIQVDCTVQNREFIQHDALRKFFEKVNDGYVLRFLDIQSVIASAPMFNDTAPFSNMPFHAAVYGMEPNPWNAYQTLNVKGKYDVRAEFVEWLIKMLHPLDTSSVIVWDIQFIKARLTDFIKWCPKHKENIERLKSRLIDLSSIFRMRAYYHPSFYGRHDLSAVATALFSKEEFNLGTVHTKRQARQALYRIKNSTGSDKVEAKESLCLYSTHNAVMMSCIFNFLKSKIS